MSDRRPRTTTPAPSSRGNASRVTVVVAAIGLVAMLVAMLWPVPKPVWLVLTEGVVAAAFAAVLLAVFNSRSLDRR